MTTETLDTGNLELRFADGTDGSISGYAAVFNGPPDSYGDVIAPGSFAGSLAEHKAAGTRPLLLWQHDPMQPIGVWEDVREDGRGLAVKGRLVLETRAGAEAYALLKAGALSGLSIGFRTKKAETRAGGGRLLKAADIIEISLVSRPAQVRARVTGIKAADAAPLAAGLAAHLRAAAARIKRT